jgi:hypothetical protein
LFFKLFLDFFLFLIFYHFIFFRMSFYLVH